MPQNSVCSVWFILDSFRITFSVIPVNALADLWYYNKKKNSFINFTTSENDIDADFHTTLNTGMLEDSKQLY